MGPSGSMHSRGHPRGLEKIPITPFELGVAGGAGPWKSSTGAKHLGTLLPTWPHRVGKVRPLGLPTLPLRCKLHLPCQLCLDPPTMCSGGSALCLTSRPLHLQLWHLEHSQVPSLRYCLIYFMSTRRMLEFCPEHLGPSPSLHRSLDFILPNY